MSKLIDIENHIENQYRKCLEISNKGNWDTRYEELYREMKNDKIREMLMFLHSKLVTLFELMNNRLPTGEYGAHYWADSSRELISVIDISESLSTVLKNTNNAFIIDQYYEKLFENCKKWLSKRDGSEIPPKTEKVILYYKKPIFLLNDSMQCNRELHTLGEQGELLGSGGFGEVYRYKHPFIDLNFAIKVFNPLFLSEEDKIEGEKRFFREAKMLFGLNHLNIVRIYDVGRFNGKPYIKMEYIEGQTLDDLRSEIGSNLSFKDASGAVIQILDGLQHAHEHGIIHRDLKPSNIMVDKSNSKKWICKIIDFGISAFMDNEGYTKLTRTGERIAGGSYIDPLLQNDPEMRDKRSDLYSASAIMYYLLTGHPPVGSDIEQYLKDSNPQLNNKQMKAVLKSLSIDINKRFTTCIEMKDALNECS